MDELERLRLGSSEQTRPDALPRCTLRLHCPDGSEATLEQIRDVLITILKDGSLSRDVEGWAAGLPSWFVSQCVRDLTETEMAEFLSWPLEKRMAWGEKWSLADWLHWFEPEQRQWEWWGAKCPSASELLITLLPLDTPFAHGALDWLCSCAGADEVILVPM
jgi:hypothetical protein